MRSLAAHLVLVVGREQEGHHRPRGPGRRLDHVGHVALVGLRVEVVQPLPRGLGVGQQVEVAPVGDALELVPTPGEQELHVGRGPRVVRQLARLVVAQAELVLGDAEVEVPAQALGQPVVVPLLALGGRHEELHLHLLELAGAEDEVLRRDLVAEGLAHLGDAEGRLLARRVEHVGEVDEHALGRLGPQVGHVALVLHRAGVGLEHQVEGPGLGQVVRAAVGADPVDLVLAPALMAVAAVHQGVGEGGQVARGGPHRRAARGWRRRGRPRRRGAAPWSATRRS